MQGVMFESKGKQLVAIEHLPEVKSAQKGVIIVVGGPQTRVGSHRLFVYLARALAKQGITVFRFDYTGAGDSEGDITAFTNIQEDISAAITTFQARHRDITELVLWGLCDAASAILLYLNEYEPPHQLNKIVLVNPWVRQEHTQAKAYLSSYYRKRFFSREFWLKLFSGKVKTISSLTDMRSFHQQSNYHEESLQEKSFVVQMLNGLMKFSGTCDILLSGNDLIADEFKVLVANDNAWRKVINRSSIYQYTMPNVDHTFSQRTTQDQFIELIFKILT